MLFKCRIPFHLKTNAKHLNSNLVHSFWYITSPKLLYPAWIAKHNFYGTTSIKERQFLQSNYLCCCRNNYKPILSANRINQQNFHGIHLKSFVSLNTQYLGSVFPFNQNYNLCYNHLPTIYLVGIRTAKKISRPNQSETHYVVTSLDEDKKFWKSKENILKDISEAKAKVKERVEEIIERENIWTIPNLLCVSRIILSPFLCYFVIASHFNIALGMFVLAGFTDLIDGMIARAFPSQASRLGSFLDPLADKILVASLFLSLSYVGIIPWALTVITIYRDAAIIGGASYIRYKSLPPPHTLSRYFDATHATAQLAPTLVGKLNTAIQLGFISASLAAPVFSYSDHYLLHAFAWITGITTVSSGISYIFSKDTYKILSKHSNSSNKS